MTRTEVGNALADAMDAGDAAALETALADLVVYQEANGFDAELGDIGSSAAMILEGLKQPVT